MLLAASLVFVTWQLPALAQSVDPSVRIATLTDAAGNLSFAPAGSDDWARATLNRPITTGDRLWVDNDGRAELHAGSTAIRLGSGTAVTVLNLDDSATQVKLTQGTLQLRVRALPPDQPVEVDTPNLAFVPSEPGDYRLDVAPDGSNTVVTMRHGHAVVYGDNRSLEMRRGDQLRFAGTDLAEAGSATNPPLDGFDRWTMARDAREDRSPSARYIAPEMTGYAALDDYGDWQEDPGYGAVWFPRVVAADWAPYSAGYWAWVAPWGWSWCDDAPWGFAPSHYGRWARIGNRWGWMPGPRSVQPVYAPALVGFIDGGHWRDRDHDHDRGNGPGVAWYPLGPREAYRPVYGASPAYVNRINHFTVNNEVINNHIRNTYINRDVPGAITGMPARAFVQGQRVPPGAHNAVWRNLPRGEANGAPPLAPVKASLHGAAPARPAPAEVMQGFARPAIAARAPGRPASDELAQRFARAGGTVPGAGPAWRGGGNAPGGNQAAPAPVRLSQAAPEFHGRNGSGQMRGGPVTPGAPGGGNSAFGPQRADGGVRAPTPQGLVGAEHGGQMPVPGGDPRTRGWTTRPDQARGMPPQIGQPAAQLQQAQQAQQAQQFQQRQAEQRAAAQQTDQQGLARQQQERQLGDQQRASRVWPASSKNGNWGTQQRAQQAQQQQQDMQRQQQRQMGDQQRAQQARCSNSKPCSASSRICSVSSKSRPAASKTCSASNRSSNASNSSNRSNSASNRSCSASSKTSSASSRSSNASSKTSSASSRNSSAGSRSCSASNSTPRSRSQHSTWLCSSSRMPKGRQATRRSAGMRSTEQA
ncbi:high-affinity branched-chain amino acid transport protein, ligand-binding receptor [Cupriavidus basilensis OR16]|uniref:High-affinity branched-chain amino acid transport protein, ligand-binding receptor n=1 Tax=Cupriavidus basilensis OR16 TaxID=1127483 RepID=H1S0S7_9BURK|nr:high-affinity branched-chain amino acid transport protein, ligand-binding receptor [Cupriavidus basilensis OR16]